MRTAILLLAAAGCTPDITSGTYKCGDQELCPPGLVCNGSDGTCVDKIIAEPFACGSMELNEPDDNATQAFALPMLGCVSQQYIAHGCLAAGDLSNWSKFSTPSNCTAVGVKANVSYPIAFQAVGLQLWDLDASMMVAMDDACTSGVVASGDDQRCLTATLANGKNYGIVVVPSGPDCGGTCNFNRYTLTLQLVTP
jgi:hypothetical protein